MIHLIIDGALLGLLVAVSLGPAFFAIIQTAISQGFKRAVYFAIGVLISDIFLVVLSYLIGASIFDNPKSKIFMGLVGGIILIIFGSISWAKKPEILKRRSLKLKEIKAPKVFAFPIKGFFMNIANPFLYFFWFGALGIVGKLAPEGKMLQSTIIFFSTTFIVTFSTDILKSFIGNKIKNFLSPRKEIIINKIVGLALVVFGIVLIFKTLNEYGFFEFIKEHF